MNEFEFDLHLTPWTLNFLKWVRDGCPGSDIVKARQFCRSSRSLLKHGYVEFNANEQPSWKLTEMGELALTLAEKQETYSKRYQNQQ